MILGGLWITCILFHQLITFDIEAHALSEVHDQYGTSAAIYHDDNNPIRAEFDWIENMSGCIISMTDYITEDQMRNGFEKCLVMHKNLNPHL